MKRDDLLGTVKSIRPQRVFGTRSVDLLVPHEIAIDEKNDLLVYDTSSPIRRRASLRTFWDFISLRDSQGWLIPQDVQQGSAFPQPDPAGDQKILKFARKWGAFGICEQHTLPISHSQFAGASVFGIGCNQPKKIIRGHEYYIEPLSFWRRAIVKISAICSLGSAMASGVRGSKEHWRDLLPYVPAGEEPWLPGGIVTSKAANGQSYTQVRVPGHDRLAWEIDDMIGIASLRPEFHWRDEGWSFDTLPPSLGLWPLFGWITLRLIAELCEAKGTMIKCPYCQDPYRTGRRPGATQDHHCPKKKCKRAYFRNYQRGRREQKEATNHV